MVFMSVVWANCHLCLFRNVPLVCDWYVLASNSSFSCYCVLRRLSYSYMFVCVLYVFGLLLFHDSLLFVFFGCVQFCYVLS